LCSSKDDWKADLRLDEKERVKGIEGYAGGWTSSWEAEGEWARDDR
jgi:hypothetical protein